MTGITDIKVLLNSMKPALDTTDYVFVTNKSNVITDEIIALNPIATIVESEGITLVISKITAEKHYIPFDVVFRKISLEVHSSLEAVGLTAAISTALAAHNISANVIAGFYHDHIFVPQDKAALALSVLKELAL